MDQINPYEPGIKLKNFPDLYDDLSSHFDLFVDTYVVTSVKFSYFKRIGFKDIFYYINLLYDNDPYSIIDVGCGECFWKDYFPKIIGFDIDTEPTVLSEYAKPDFFDYFNENFSEKHAKRYDCGMALNSIDCVGWDEIENQIILAMDIVKDRFLFTFSFGSLRKYTLDKDFAENFKEYEYIKDYLDNILDKLPYNIILLDYPKERGYTYEQTWGISIITGSVRFILEHKD